MLYTFKITETRTKVVTIEADSAEEALDQVHDNYWNADTPDLNTDYDTIDMEVEEE